jgi:hypothetical protein
LSFIPFPRRRARTREEAKGENDDDEEEEEETTRRGEGRGGRKNEWTLFGLHFMAHIMGKKKTDKKRTIF